MSEGASAQLRFSKEEFTQDGLSLAKTTAELLETNFKLYKQRNKVKAVFFLSLWKR